MPLPVVIADATRGGARATRGRRVGASRRAAAAAWLASWLAIVAVASPEAAGAAQAPILSEAARAKREEAIASVLREMKSRAAFPATEDAVQLALWDWARTGDRTSLELAGRFSARMTEGAGDRVALSPLSLYLVAQADGAAFRAAEGERLLESSRALLVAGQRRATTDSWARLVQDFFARAAVLGSEAAHTEALMAAESLFRGRTRLSGSRLTVLSGGSEADFTTLSDHLECLDTAVLSYEASGAGPALQVVSLLAHEMLLNYWDDRTSRFSMLDRETVGLPPSARPLLGARAALSLWRAGCATGETMLLGRSQRALDAVLDEALRAPESAAAAAHAAALMTRPAVAMVIVGEAGHPVLIAMRRAALGAFEPARVILNVDPLLDETRLAELEVPLDEAPALFFLRDGRRSAAVKDPAQVKIALAAFLRSDPGTKRP